MEYCFCIGQNNKSCTNKEVLFKIKILANHTDISDLKEPKRSLWSSSRINMGQIEDITDLEGNNSFEFGYINRVKFEKKIFFRVTHYDYSNTFRYYLTVFHNKEAALNKSKYIKPKFTGSKIYHYENGKLKEKVYYSNGVLLKREIYYNNPYNTIKHNVHYDSVTFKPVYDHVYNTRGLLVTQYFFDEHGKCKSSRNFNSNCNPLPSFVSNVRINCKRPRQ